VPFEVLDPAGCIVAEPALASVRGKIAGGLRLPNDETGDCFKFTNALAAIATGLGVKFEYEHSISHINLSLGRVDGIVTSAGTIKADAYVAALGCFSTLLLKPLGIRLPIYPVKGYSLTVPIVDSSRAPVSTVMDETFEIAITRLGDRMRIGGMAELSGYSNDLPAARRLTLEHSVRDLFDGAGDYAEASFWSGLRPMTPDGTPIIGPTPYANLFINSGHGTLGWTMACGSGRVLADMISGRKPEIQTSDLGSERH
jgi:D-amino-acid dehydrogenase